MGLMVMLINPLSTITHLTNCVFLVCRSLLVSSAVLHSTPPQLPTSMWSIIRSVIPYLVSHLMSLALHIQVAKIEQTRCHWKKNFKLKSNLYSSQLGCYTKGRDRETLSFMWQGDDKHLTLAQTSAAEPISSLLNCISLKVERCAGAETMGMGIIITSQWNNIIIIALSNILMSD